MKREDMIEQFNWDTGGFIPKWRIPEILAKGWCINSSSKEEGPKFRECKRCGKTSNFWICDNCIEEILKKHNAEIVGQMFSIWDSHYLLMDRVRKLEAKAGETNEK